MNKIEHQELLKKTYFTVLYFNFLNVAPTSFEVWRHFLDINQQSQKIPFFKVSLVLNELKKNKKIFNQHGFWETDQKKIDQSRIAFQKKSLIKIRRIKKWVKVIEHIPFVRGIFVSGTLAFGVSRKDSDWDVLVIMRKDRIWLGRFLLTIFLIIFNKKRKSFKIKDRFCLNHFLTENNLIPVRRNEYIACEFSFMFPVLGGTIFNNFSYLNWNWFRKFLPNFEIVDGRAVFINSDRVNFFKIRGGMEKILEFLGIAKVANAFCKKWMTKRIENNPMTFQEGSVVIYDDGELAFWPDCKNKNIINKIIV